MAADHPDKQEYLRHFLSSESSLREYVLTHVRAFDVAEDLLQQAALMTSIDENVHFYKLPAGD